MSFNTFGKIFRFTTWGESHGPAIGCVIDVCPPNIPLAEKDIQAAGGTVIVTKFFGFSPRIIYSQCQQIKEKIIHENSKQF